MYTVDTTLESLKKYDITETDLLDWEKSLGLDIAVDAYGRKQYSPHHINLFKNVKKHLALGRTLDEIRQIIVLPPLLQSRPQVKSIIEQSVPATEKTTDVSYKNQAMESQSVAVPVTVLSSQASVPQEDFAPVFDPVVALAASSSSSVSPVLKERTSSGEQSGTSASESFADSKNKLGQNSTERIPLSIPAAGKTDVPISDKSVYASIPKKPVLQAAPSAVPPPPSMSARPSSVSAHPSPSIHAPAQKGASDVVNLVQRLTEEKDQLYKKLLETEKLNSHLYSANSLFHKKTNELSRQISQLRESLNENERFKLLDDKARLHKQLLDAERNAQGKQEEIQAHIHENMAMKEEIQQYKDHIQRLSAAFDASKFRGDWMEAGRLVDVLYDNFGINIESERVRLFRISDVPSRRYGRMAIIHTNYQYETNNLWRRDETLAVAYSDEDTLEGELTAEYILDGIPVAKALYRITCRRHC